MAKMFYTLEEAAERLQKSEDDVKEMAKSGQIQEFRDRDRLMFKVDQIDLLSGGDEDSTGEVHLELEDTSATSAIGLTGSGMDMSDESKASDSPFDSAVDDSAIGSSAIEESAIGLADSREGSIETEDDASRSSSGTGTGISVFDTGHGEEPAVGETQVDAGDDLGLDSVGSGSGLLDLTRESDDTSLGAELLEEVYSSEDNIEIPAHASGLFEAATEVPSEESEAAPAMAIPMVIEAYDGTGSGLGAGLLIGALVALICVAVMVFVGITGATPDLATRISGNLWIWAGGLLGVTIIFGLVGLFLGKSSE